ncbi:MAG: LacI family DNA-binding transcriptional regulator [Chloroflexota bacterium]
MAVTLKDIADRVGKSVPTVSRALAGFEDISPKTREYVQAVAKEMGYVPNTFARKLQSQKSDAVGLILPGTENLRFSDPFFSQLLSGIIEQTSQAGLDLTISAANPETELETYTELIRGQRVDGFIVVRTQRKDKRIALLRDQKVPFVAFGRMEAGNDFSYIDEDGGWGIEQIVDHLVDLGHTHLSCIAEPTRYTKSYNRVQGFINALKKHHLPLRESDLVVSNFRQRSGRVAALQLLEQDKPPTAIVAVNDLLAIGAIHAIQERGLAVGKDISVTGFDDIVLAEMANPGLTTLHQPAHEMGSLVAKSLIKQIRNEKNPHHQVVLKPTLVIRGSTAPPFSVNSEQ